MFNWLRRAIPTEAKEIFLPQPVARKKINFQHVFPPKKGHRRPEWSSQDDLFWTTKPASVLEEGDITSEIVKPRHSIWLSFKNG